jgi:capsular polysaccharide biosynthesis protein
VLKDVAIGPDSGVMFVPSRKLLGGDGMVFIPSVGHHYFFFMCGIQEVMRNAKASVEETPVCSMPVIGYYHEFLEGLLRVVKSFQVFGDIKVLVPLRRPEYIDEMLDFVGVAKDRIIVSDSPLIVKKGVLIPRWSDNLKADLIEFRDYLVSRLPVDCMGEKRIYISRAKSRRSLPDECKLEQFLADKGFRIAYFEEMPFVEQLKAVRAADMVISPHGAGLSNLIVARPGTKVVELMTQGWANSCYGHLASSLGLEYVCIDADAGCLPEEIAKLLM